MYTLKFLLFTDIFRHWRSVGSGMEVGRVMGRPAGCENCWCPAVRPLLPSHYPPTRPSRETPRRPASRSAPGGSVGLEYCIPPCSPSQRAEGHRSCHRSRRALGRSSRPGVATSSPRLPRCCKRSSACGWSSPGSRREALWGSGLERNKRITQTLAITSWTNWQSSTHLHSFCQLIMDEVWYTMYWILQYFPCSLTPPSKVSHNVQHRSW